jgi:hypothetical protein
MGGKLTLAVRLDLSGFASALGTNPKGVGPFAQGVDFPPAQAPADRTNLHVEQCAYETERQKLEKTASAAPDAEHDKHEQDAIDPKAHLLDRAGCF